MDAHAITLAHSHEFAITSLLELGHPHIAGITITSPDQWEQHRAEVILLDHHLLQHHSLASWSELPCTLVLPESLCGGEVAEQNHKQTIVLPRGADPQLTLKAIGFAAEHTRLRQQNASLNRQLKNKGEGLERLVEVGIALSGESDLEQLLEKILAEGQRLLDCDAASLFLIDHSEEPASLLFKLTRNASIDVPFKEHRMPMDKSSIAGYSAITGETLKIDDAYTLDDDLPYQFNRSFDLAMGYRTVNMAVLPMIDQQQKIVGVLEFINRKREADSKLTIPALTESMVYPFDQEALSLLQALASQAAVAIENRRLLNDVHNLFDGFVQASVFAIEQRDPTTSGHSFRVADLCESVAASFDASGEFKHIRFREEQIRELRFAALLHDFGKVGVREHVLTKAKKLSTAGCEMLRYRVALAKSKLHNQSLEQLLNLAISKHGLTPELRSQIERERDTECGQLDEYLEAILTANEPTMLAEGTFEHLERIKAHLVQDCHGNLRGLISEEEFQALSIPKGSLSTAERKEIESHVNHTIDFLRLIPWTDSLKHVPLIAGAHHEKLDGKGYPNQLPAEQIPFQSRIMTVCDIYDALTASDRPYKPAMPRERALSILEFEAKDGMLDSQVVRVFIEAQCFLAVEGKRYGFTPPAPASEYQHHVCDYDLHLDHKH
ncbi:GAF domain-containing protein [Pseudomaricurvus alkylphenolicus]|uniref:HD family phosphohydrolase n=1 Tax=Pseudomaricurvus alkylphenolicus TaxID=1306991 RepID=UPI001423DB51|nr:HD family phosphohydrolase [Pseudomaricurvus alkylphenolicus]NIB41800.1 GAF domain-containing protein [Pseudomaricurvus alkylphenolicus]